MGPKATSGRWQLTRLILAVAVGVGTATMSAHAIAQDAAAAAAPTEPQPDPSGIATGDKSAAVDAGGNAFVVAEPTDKAAADYADKKKAFDEYQAAVAKEPLAAKLAD